MSELISIVEPSTFTASAVPAPPDRPLPATPALSLADVTAPSGTVNCPESTHVEPS